MKRFQRSLGKALAIGLLALCTTAHAQVLGPGWWKAAAGGGSNPSVLHETDTGFIGAGCNSGCTTTVPSTSAGNAFAIGIVDFSNVAPSWSATDPQGDTCTPVSNSGNAGSSATPYDTWIICPNLAGGTTSVTITGVNGNAVEADIFELTNVATSGTIYEGASGGANSSSNTIGFSLSAPTSFANDIVLLAGWGASGGMPTSPTSPWVNFGVSFYQPGTGIGTYSGTLTLSGASNISYAQTAVKP